MSQPTPYTITFSFTDWSTTYPATPQPGVSLDNEFQAIKATTDQIIANIALVQRDDGALRNAIVTPDSLSPATLLLFGASAQWTPRGAWAAGTVYAKSDVVQNDTQTLVCVVAHTASDDIDTDITAGDWLLIFDTAGSTPADGSVTEPKLADGAVSSRAIGFTALDLAGTIRSASGVQAGTGGPSGLMHAKLLTGDVYVTAERGAQDSGIVGYRWLGGTGGFDWTATQASSGNDLAFTNSSGGLALTLRKANTVDSAGQIRSQGASTLVADTGAGVGFYYQSSTGFIDSYDHDALVWTNVKLRGLTTYLSAGGVDVLKATSTGVDITGTMTRGSVDLGWLDLPQNAKATAYTLALADRGKHIYSANTAGQTITIPTNTAVAFPIGSAITIVNDGTNPITLSTTGITLRLAGAASTGNRTLAAHGIATLLKVGTNSWYVSGAGLS